MIFKEFLQKELKDNSDFLFRKEEDLSYKYIVNDREQSQLIIVQTDHSRRSDDDIHKLLNIVSEELFEKLSDKKFLIEHLYLFNDKEYEHNTSDPFFEYIPGFSDQLNKSIIRTGNLIGYLNKKHNGINYSINISSRFGDNFLKNLIASSDGFLELPHSGDAKTSELAEWLLIFLWKIKLKHAYRLGLPKEFIRQSEPIVKIRGNLNINKSIDNPSFIPPYHCIYRQHSYDNSVTRLISNCFRFIKNKAFIEDCYKVKQDFLSATGGKRLSVNSLLAYKKIANPYFSDYNEVAFLSKMIIKREMADFTSDKDDISAFFFDISMLFEHFIRKIFIRNGSILEEKNKKGYSVPCGGYNNRYSSLFPDIIIKNADGSIDIYDVKYKRFYFKDGVNLEDLYQLNTYVGHLLNYADVNRCGFIYPFEENNKEHNGSPIIQEMQVAGRSIIFQVLFFTIPKDDAINYSQKFNANIQSFIASSQYSNNTT